MLGSTRERILDEGLALMSQAGLGGVTLGVLAEQVGTFFSLVRNN
jgi:AcrR family transcriptional regulator